MHRAVTILLLGVILPICGFAGTGGRIHPVRAGGTPSSSPQPGISTISSPTTSVQTFAHHTGAPESLDNPVEAFASDSGIYAWKKLLAEYQGPHQNQLQILHNGWITGFLRGEKIAGDSMVEAAYEADNVFRNAPPIPADLVVYRGAPAGSVGHDPAYLFVTEELRYAETYKNSGGEVSSITIPKGSRVLLGDPKSPLPYRQKILVLPRNSELTQTGTDPNGLKSYRLQNDGDPAPIQTEPTGIRPWGAGGADIQTVKVTAPLPPPPPSQMPSQPSAPIETGSKPATVAANPATTETTGNTEPKTSAVQAAKAEQAEASAGEVATAAEAGSKLATVLGKLGDAAGVIGGVYQMKSGIEELKHGEKAWGAVDAAGGAATTGISAAALAGVAGATAALPVVFGPTAILDGIRTGYGGVKNHDNEQIVVGAAKTAGGVIMLGSLASGPAAPAVFATGAAIYAGAAIGDVVYQNRNWIANTARSKLCFWCSKPTPSPAPEPVYYGPPAPAPKPVFYGPPAPAPVPVPVVYGPSLPTAQPTHNPNWHAPMLWPAPVAEPSRPTRDSSSGYCRRHPDDNSCE